MNPSSFRLLSIEKYLCNAISVVPSRVQKLKATPNWAFEPLASMWSNEIDDDDSDDDANNDDDDDIPNDGDAATKSTTDNRDPPDFQLPPE